MYYQNNEKVPSRRAIFEEIAESWMARPADHAAGVPSLNWMKLLITGICGFVGSSLAQVLLERRADLSVVGIDNLMRPGSELNRAHLRKLQVRNAAIEADVRDLKQGSEAIEERARYELGMVKPDEVFFHIVDATPASPPKAAR